MKRYVVDSTVEINSNFEKDLAQKIVLRDLLNHDFWNQMKNDVEVLKLISEQQKMSESKHAHFDRVVFRWQAIEQHIRALKNRSEFDSKNDLERLFHFRVNKHDKFIKSIWRYRLKAQMTNIHWIAYHLHSANHHIQMIVNTQSKMLRFLKKYVTLDTDIRKLNKNFFDFKTRQDVRELLASDDIWDCKDDSLYFWQLVMLVVFE